MKYTIGQIAEIIDGDRGVNYPKQDDFSESGFCLFLNTGNVTKQGFSFDTVQFISKEKDNSLRKGRLQRGDIVYTTRGTVGNAAFYSSTIPYDNVRINSGMVILRCFDDIVDNQFLYQVLKSNYYRPYFKKFCTGSAQPQLPIKNFSTISLDIPPQKTQKRIADILSAYDDLIENNQKQIKLLEEAAQRLYKEWFIDLRFPGHETTHVIDGVPEGWERKQLGELCTIQKRAVTPEAIEPHTPYIGLEHIPRKDFCLSSWGDASEISSNKYVFNKDDIIFGQIRPYFHKVGFAIVNGVASTDSFVMRPQENTWGLFLLTVSSEAFVNYSYQTCKEGAKMPRADWNQMKTYPVLVAENDIQRRFEEIISGIVQKVAALARQSKLLAEARDRLLPKLMSGDIEV